MESPLTTRAALLLALREGPGYGLELIRRVLARSGGKVRVSEARVYPSLKALERQRLVRASTMAPRGLRGARSRTYYDLTVEGVEASNECREALRVMFSDRPGWPELDSAERARMAERLAEADALATCAGDLAGAGRRPADVRG